MTLKIKKIKVPRTDAVTYQVKRDSGIIKFFQDGRKVDQLPVGILTTRKGLMNRVRPSSEWIAVLLAEKRNRSTEGISFEFDEAAQELIKYLDDKFGYE